MTLPTRTAIAGVIWAVFGLASAAAAPLQFAMVAGNGEIASFVLDTAVLNTYDPVRYPGPVRGVYLNAAYDLNFEGVHVPLSDVATIPGMTGDGRLLTSMEVGPLFDNLSLSLSLVFLNPTLVSPLSPDPLAYESSFVLFQSVLFPQIPPPRTNVTPLFTLTVTTPVPEPSYIVIVSMIALCIAARRQRRC
jgi:hypothetical protein